MPALRRRWLPLLMLLAGLVLLALGWGGRAPPERRQATPTATNTPLPPLFPSRTAAPPGALSATAAAVSPAATLPDATPLESGRAVWQRAGAAGNGADLVPAHAAGLRLGHYLDWDLDSHPSLPAGVNHWPMVRLTEAGPRQGWQEIAAAVRARPGAIWVAGNEPDVRWQDNVTPARYAELYHQLYHFIKERDPTARLAIGGVSQPTPLRLAYLDLVLNTYQARYGRPLPVDVWNVHAFILREEENSWGVGIPPGMTAAGARLYDGPDHGDLAIFRQNLLDFRAWMAARGYGDRPLAVTEYGILFPHDYGYPPETVAAFMLATFDFFLAPDQPHGDPADDGRLAQWWFWYSLHDDEAFPTGNLYDRPTGRLTALGELYALYLANH